MHYCCYLSQRVPAANARHDWHFHKNRMYGMDGSDVFHMCLMDELKGQTCGEVAIAKWYVYSRPRTFTIISDHLFHLMTLVKINSKSRNKIKSQSLTILSFWQIDSFTFLNGGECGYSNYIRQIFRWLVFFGIVCILWCNRSHPGNSYHITKLFDCTISIRW